MHDEPTAVQVPLRNRSGDVVAYTLISPEDAELVNRSRWSLMSTGYVQGWRDKQPVLLHRFLLGLSKGDPRECDHRNFDKLDNQRGNLRAVTVDEHGQNRPRSRGGAYPCRGKWQARVKLNGRPLYLGSFETQELAQAAAAEWRRANMPYATN